jgi:hypothetical protein
MYPPRPGSILPTRGPDRTALPDRRSGLALRERQLESVPFPPNEIAETDPATLLWRLGARMRESWGIPERSRRLSANEVPRGVATGASRLLACRRPHLAGRRDGFW